MTCCQTKCQVCGDWGHEKATHQCSFCGDYGHEGGCQDRDPSGGGVIPPSGAGGTETIADEGGIESLAVNSTTSGDPVQTSFEGSVFKISINREHELFQEFVAAVKKLDPEDDLMKED
jgi:hypothetical protein